MDAVKLDLDSTIVVRILALKIVDGEKDSNALLEIYRTWSGVKFSNGLIGLD